VERKRTKEKGREIKEEDEEGKSNEKEEEG
jgi:hypothetical protein